MAEAVLPVAPPVALHAVVVVVAVVAGINWFFAN
jgi:hypothetical protein